ncbi:hypothetical protein IscW_ISCW012736 [Ixodes scapularis]|uniref:Uncharacterized protein n=1 Tax=Ixodes scapularis TaxID=6945 RepID=B7QAN0_IXOSC|nr:hypothetical protein IscW_ISCW012736 [Ixodes scapularis]|eukprot:XP_002412606.1 hypothetical protein IscW_ISCW012736 [Ixodes scapularis]
MDSAGIRIPRTWRRRLLPGVWILFGQTLSLGYSGTLISYMAHPGLEEAVDTVAKLAQAIRKGTFTCGTIRDAAEHSMLREVDAAAGGVSVLPERQRHVQFSSSYLLDRTTFVIRAPSTASRTGVVFRPFSKRVSKAKHKGCGSLQPAH